MSKSTAAISDSPRQIVHRTRGLRHGAITRLMSPSDLGQILKPFVFLDLFDTEGASLSGMALHPHSGIATLTYMIEGSVRYEDTSGATGILPEGGIEWFKAGHGAWHGGGPNGSRRAHGFQLWVALPPEHELGPTESVYQAPEAVRRHGPAIVLLGKYGGVSSPLQAPSSMTYLFVHLKAGESWSYQPPSNHTICWVALSAGSLAVPERVEAGELAVFEPSNQAIDFSAEADTEFVLGSAASHRYELALGNYSVHTGPATLKAGERRIAEIQARLKKEGRL
jgi:redox-sensitive bicupin YhaK (pirin superfamily)